MTCAAIFTSAGEDGTVRQVDLRERSHSMTLIGKLTHHGNMQIPEVLQAWLHWLSSPLFAKLCSVSAATSPSTLRLLHGHHGMPAWPCVLAHEEVWRTHGEASCAADQRQEKTGVVKTRVPINTLAVCPLHPHLFATGGGDAIGALTRPSPQALFSEQDFRRKVCIVIGGAMLVSAA